MSFEPKILGFLCNWCSYAGADLAGVSRVQYPPNIRVIRVMCSGRVDPKFIFKALEIGLDGVIVMGCHPGDCHYLEGNYEAEKKFDAVTKLLKYTGFDNRVRLEWVSASEGVRFGQVVTEFTNQIRELGPSPLRPEKNNAELLEKIQAMELAATTDRIRALVGRQRKIIEQENEYGERIDEEIYEELLDSAIYEEYQRARILLTLGKNIQSVKEIAKEINIDPSEVLKHILILKSRALVDYERVEGNTPLYIKK